MARVSIPEGTEQQPVVPSGTYQEGCKVVSAKIRQVPGENADKEEYLDIGVAIPTTKGMVFAHTTPFARHHTRTTVGSGSQVNKFVTQLGHNPADFDTDELVGTMVVVEVNLRAFKNKAGEEQQQVEITNVARVA